MFSEGITTCRKAVPRDGFALHLKCMEADTHTCMLMNIQDSSQREGKRRPAARRGFETGRLIFEDIYFWREYTEFGGYLPPSMGVKFSDVQNSAVAFPNAPLAGWPQIVAFYSFIENLGVTFTRLESIGWMKDTSRTSEKGGPGNFGPGCVGAEQFGRFLKGPARWSR